MMGCGCFRSAGQQKLETKEVLDFSILRNCLYGSGLLIKHPGQGTVDCKRACLRQFYVMSAFSLCSDIPGTQGASHPRFPHGWITAHRRQECQGASFLQWKMFNWIKPEADACLASSLGEGPLPVVRALIVCRRPRGALSRPLCLWHPHLPALERASWSSIYLNSLQAIRAPCHQLPQPLQQQIGAFLTLKKTAPTCHV